jgi:hypothetical protein
MRWFHLHCIGEYDARVETGEWYCADCAVDSFVKQEQEVHHSQMEQQIGDALIDLTGDHEMSDPEEEAEQEELVSDSLSGIFLGEQAALRSQSPSPELELQATTGSALDVEQQTGNALMDLTGDHEMSDPGEEVEQEELVSDGLPGTFVGEQAALRSQSPSPELDLQGPTGSALDAEIAEAVLDELPAREEDVIEHISSASPVPRVRTGSTSPLKRKKDASGEQGDTSPRKRSKTTPDHDSALPQSGDQAAPAQLESSVNITQPETTPPVSRQASPQESRHSTPQASRQPSPQASPVPEIAAPEEENASAALPDVDEEAIVILSGADREETPLNILPSIEEAPIIFPATHSEVPTQDADLEEEEAPIQDATSDHEADHEVDQAEDQESHMCRPDHLCIVDNDNTGLMVACDGNCTGQWYHYQCVGLTVKPKSSRDWFCPECRAERRNAKKRATQQGQPSNAPASQPATQQAQPATEISRASRSKRAAKQTVEPEYCTCGTPADNDMIACDRHCAKEWFHFACVGLTAETVPEGDWYCDECQIEQERKKKKKGKNTKREKKKAVRRKAQN